MTFSSASVSACDVDDVAATAAGVGGLRAGGKAACWRVAGMIAAAAGGAAATGRPVAAGRAAAAGEFLAAVVARGVVLGTTLRAIGRGFGNGILAFGEASAAAHAANPTASARVVVIAVDRNAAARAEGGTAFLCIESRIGGRPRSI
jgi:hypothetical protein